MPSASAMDSVALFQWSCNSMVSEKSLLIWVKINTFFLWLVVSQLDQWTELTCCVAMRLLVLMQRKEQGYTTGEWTEVGTSRLSFSMTCDLWSFEAIHETVPSVCAYLNSFIILTVNNLLAYKSFQKFGCYKVLDLLIFIELFLGHAAGLSTQALS